MDAANTPKRNGSLFHREDADELSVEPLKPRRPSRTVREIESLLTALQVAMAMELNSAKQEILQRLAEVENSLEIVVRELARNTGDASEAGDGSDPR